MNTSKFTKAAALAAAAALTFTLSACGGSTADSGQDSSISTVATLSDEKSSEGKESSTSSETSTTSEPGAADEPVDETGAEEIDEAPNQQIPRSEDDKEYLKLLQDGGIDTEGEIADQLIGTAHEVCVAEKENKREFVTAAVGGQLVAQKKTELEGKEAAQLIAESAKKVYC